ncbi:zinc-binding alcohol dehydrogenase family protein [Azohydromonas caseinilytica]|uniref:Zinc-type alcohol dehydrogenase-like protein n=1 Tax=Azohydromonas caseinilytica TaxID=2728836 RepID=A0A848FG58_9BURK|nr:zinc-binding alcohol dehydrogenase family protein [Azohydromonas caseinilytica]NML17243.1 zinc-binding alcohol dehydrogenase family protein [Azohydromonas caseinilytica]
MKAVAYLEAGAIERADALLDVELPMPQPGPRDLRVRVAAVSVNPVDTKIRKSRQPQPQRPEVLGWDAVGIVDAVGAQVEGFSVGDRVFYAGAIDRPGTNAEYHLVDARIVGRAPVKLSDAEAAALPLTAITAWELLFDRLGVPQGGGEGQALLVIGGAGGVGSMLIQLARQLTRLTVIATASRPETQAWCRELGAHHVIDHAQAFAPQLAAIGWPQVPLVASLTQSDEHWAAIVEATAPQGRIALIDDPVQPLDVMALKRKSLSLHWELMFTRSLFQTPDMAAQGALLDEVAKLVDEGRLRTTVTQTLQPINAANVRQAHALIESGRARGKVTIQGW